MAVLALAVSGCSDGTKQRSYENEGPLCATASQDGHVLVRMQLVPCLSSSCDSVVEKSCSVEADGQTLIARSRWTVESSVRGACTDDCGTDLCTAEIADLLPGTYTLKYGAQSVELEVPSDSGTYIDRQGFRAINCDPAP